MSMMLEMCWFESAVYALQYRLWATCRADGKFKVFKSAIPLLYVIQAVLV